MVEEAYVSFDCAKLLREKGFDEVCEAVYDPSSKEFIRTGWVQNSKMGGATTGNA